MRIPIGLSSYERAEGDLPGLPVVNMFAEQTASEDVVLQSRRGLVDRSADMGAGPVKQLLKADGVLSGALFGVSNGTLYEATTSKGAIAGSGPVRMAGNEIGLMVTAGAGLYYYDGTTLASVTYPDSASVADVFVGGARFWTVRADTGKLYWTDALEADVEALDFATAESFPDKLLQGLWIDGMAILFGAESIEFWQQTGNSDLPITPLQNMVVERGIKATGCACRIGETFAAVSNHNEVIYGSQAQVISNVGLQERIAASSAVSLFTFRLDGQEFLCLRLDSETQVWNGQTWSEFATYGLSNWCAQCYAGGVFGSATDGKTLQWGSDYTEALATNNLLERRWRGGFPIEGGGMPINNVQVRCNVGQTPYLSGDYTAPTLEMRVSRNAGRTFGTYRGRSLGAQGDYDKKVIWRALGQASYPGFMAEWRLTDPVGLRVSGCFINESWGGR